MEVARSNRRRAARWLAIGIAGVVTALTVVLAPAATASGAPIDPATATESIQVWVRLSTDKSGVPDVGVEVTGNGFDEKFVTGKDGKVLVGLPAGGGEFTVTLDESTFPKGAGYANLNPQVKNVQATNVGVPANFLLGTQFKPSTGANPNPGDTSSGTPADDGSGGTTETSPPFDWSQLGSALISKTVTGIIFGLLLALAAIGLSLIYGTTGLNNFAHGELVTFGALMAYTFSNLLGWPAAIAIALAIIFGGLFGYVQNQFLWKPLRKRGLPLIPLMIVTIGLSLALRYVFAFIWGADRLTLPTDPSPFLVVGPVSLRFTDVAGSVVAIVLIVATAFFLQRTRIGKATRAVSDNRSLAAASGINVESVIRVVWVGGAALAALAGVFIGYYQSLRWDTGASILLLLFASVTLGGLGTAYGALVGSLVIGVLMNVSTIWIPENLKYVAALVVMILILLLRPQGILGKRDRIG